MAHKISLTNREEVAEGTMAFYLEKPEDFDFKAGQSLDLTLIKPPETDEEGNMRSFSISSAPYEPYLRIATRMRDTAFKRSLAKMPMGSLVKIEGPFGNMTLHSKASRPAVMLAGGIGITPFISMAKQAAYEELTHSIFLFYSNRRPEDAPFMDELLQLERANSNFRLIPTMTDIEKSKLQWGGEKGRINWNMIEEFAPQAKEEEAVFYIAGPPGMVSEMHKMLNTAGINDDDIRFEEFTGY